MTTQQRRSYRSSVTGSGAKEDPYRPLLPATFRPGDSWTAQHQFSGSGSLDVEVMAGATVHRALDAAAAVASLGDLTKA